MKASLSNKFSYIKSNSKYKSSKYRNRREYCLQFVKVGTGNHAQELFI